MIRLQSVWWAGEVKGNRTPLDLILSEPMTECPARRRPACYDFIFLAI